MGFLIRTLKLGFTGTQIGMTDPQIDSLWALLENFKRSAELELHHGDCVGADAKAHEISVMLGVRIFLHPPIVQRKRAFCRGAYKIYVARPYLQRNRDIVTLTEALIATPRGSEELRSGTWSTVRYARRLKRPVHLIKPNGQVIVEDPV